MAQYSYIRLPNPTWAEIPGFSPLSPFGWEIKGVRGYIWATTDLDFIVISYKGTSPPSLFPDLLSTVLEDKLQVCHIPGSWPKLTLG
jgi:putative lipase involved disintegration of autophagic bodies